MSTSTLIDTYEMRQNHDIDINIDFKKKLDAYIKLLNSSENQKELDDNLKKLDKLRTDNQVEEGKIKNYIKIEKKKKPSANLQPTEEAITRTHLNLNKKYMQVNPKYGKFIKQHEDIAKANNSLVTDSKSLKSYENKSSYYFPDNIKGDNIDININKDLIEEKLLRCADLENLYLLKHNELLKMFEFSVLIFDRYSYATELLIYLVKYLRELPPRVPAAAAAKAGLPSVGGITTGTIKVPKVIITELPELIANQKNIFEHMNKLKASISDVKIGDGTFDDIPGLNSDITDLLKGSKNKTVHEEKIINQILHDILLKLEPSSTLHSTNNKENIIKAILNNISTILLLSSDDFPLPPGFTSFSSY